MVLGKNLRTTFSVLVEIEECGLETLETLEIVENATRTLARSQVYLITDKQEISKEYWDETFMRG